MQVEKARLLIDNKSEYVEMGNGVVVFVCFLKGAETDDLHEVVSSLLNATMHSVPPAGNLEKTAFESSSSATFVRRHVMVIPQATLAGVLKRKQQQYHAQTDKETSARLYAQMCDEFKAQLSALDADATVVCGTFGNRRA
jgi:D-tyrosyl-tRNA(Tyr) deacylase